jgi:hypothetical protein
LLTEHVPGRYAFHDLLRAYAAEQADETEARDDRLAATGRALDHYLHTANMANQQIYDANHQLTLGPPLLGTQPEPHGDARQALAWFEAEHQVLAAAATLATRTGHDRHAWQIRWTTTHYLDRQGYWQDWLGSHQAALAGARRVPDPNARRHALLILAHLADGAAEGRVPLPLARAWAQEAVDLSGDDDDAGLRMSVIWELAFIEAMLGIDPEPRLGPLSAPGPADQVPLHDSADRIRAVRAMWRGDVRRATELLAGLLNAARKRAEEWSCGVFMLHQLELMIRVGDWSQTARLLDEYEAATASSGFSVIFSCRFRAFLAAAKGDPPGAVGAAKQIELDARDAGPYRTMWHLWEARRAAGLAALVAGDPAAAADILADVHREMTARGFRDPGTFPLAPDLIEALALSGQLDAARSVLAELEQAAAAQDHPWARAGAARARAAIASSAGDDAAAAAALESAAAQYRKMQLPFDEARTLLALGAAHRRMRQFRAARTLLADAAQRLDHLGCPPLAARARDELARIVVSTGPLPD